MKFRIIGTLFVLAVLVAMVLLLPGNEQGTVPNQQQQQNGSDLQPLKIN
jgi:hypothetical protein